MPKSDRDRFQVQLGQLLEQIEDPVKLYKTALAQAARFMGAGRGAIVLRHPVSGSLRVHGWGRDGETFDEATVRAFLDLERPALPDDVIMAPFVVGGRATGVMVLERDGEPFPGGAGRFLVRVCRKVAHEAGLREERRLNRVVDQIKERTVRELRPKDLFYQVLHGLRTLTRYDHSSALLVAEEDGARLVLHAEQIAWTKAKSRRIGRKIRLPEETRGLLRRAGEARVASFEAPRGRRGAQAAKDAEPADLAVALARLLRWGGKGKEPQEGTILWAPLHHDGTLLGVLKIAALRPAAFGDPEIAAVGRVLGHVSSVIHNARRALSMEERIIDAEKKHAMADLARAISHDVKNAIGAILPLAQQAREELQAGTFDRAVLAQDLQQIEQSAQICQRIFDGMLQLARSGVRPPERAALPRILQGSVGILGSRVRRLGVTLEMRIPDGLPDLNAGHGGLEQLFLNLLTNALDAMPAGGRLRVTARALAHDRIEVKVADTGAGIPAEQLKRIHEPFYTTKDDGFGLGLAICRSILWENGGDMRVESAPGRGTTVTVTLVAAPPAVSATPAAARAQAKPAGVPAAAPPSQGARK
jgi:two-component system, NtrC family, sensor kinase